MRSLPRITAVCLMAGGLLLTSAGVASAPVHGGQTFRIPVPGCAATVTAPSVTFSVNPTTASGTTGGATATCV
jgi:hypothetical protein